MKPLCRKAIPLLACLLIAGCATGNHTRVLTDFDSGREITLAVGAVFTVELPGNRTTGYGWRERSEGNSVVEKLSGPAYVQSATPFGMVGVGGTESWQFRTLKAGRQVLRFEYARPWEMKVAPVKTVTFNLTVGEDSR